MKKENTMKRHTAKLKEDLIQTGVEEIKNHGIDKVSLRTIAKVCGVTHGTPYKHFESKEMYLKAVLARLSDFCSSQMTQNLDLNAPARQQLLQLGLNVVTFAQVYPYVFEALFIKYPFNYMEMTENTIVTTSQMSGFHDFKQCVVKLRQEENLLGSEAETLVHFWSFISGLGILVKSPLGDNFSYQMLQDMIEQMLSIYIKGGQL